MLSVTFEPEQKIRKRRQEIIHELQVKYPKYFNPRFAYDGDAILFASRVLDFDGQSDANSLPVRFGPNPLARPTVHVSLTRTSAKPIKPIALNSLIRSQGGPELLEQSTPAINLLQLIIRQGQNWTSFPRNAKAYFVEAGSESINGQFELWRGFFQSVRPSIGRMLVNVDITMAAMYQRGPVINIAMRVLGVRNMRDLYVDRNTSEFRKLEKFFKNLRVTFNSPGMRRMRTKRVLGLEPRAGHFEFEENGKHTTVADYFRSKSTDQANPTIKFPQCFGIVVSIRGGNKGVVPAEMCEVVEGQLYRGKLPEDVLSNAIQTFAKMRPDRRLRAIQDGNVDGHSLESPAQQYKTNDIITDAGMQISREPLKVDGRVLDATQVRPRDGSWNLLGKQFYQAATVHVWAFINFIDGLDHNQVIRPFAKQLAASCISHGMEPFGYRNGHPINFENILNNTVNEMHAYFNRIRRYPDRVLFIILLPQNAATTRAGVKFWGDVQNGISTQCVRESKIVDRRGRPVFKDQYCNNLALKINARLGGINSIPKSDCMEFLKEKPFIIMGADVSHPGPGVMDRPSIASLVFSVDRHGTQYRSVSQMQPPRVEAIHHLERMVEMALTTFRDLNLPPPVNIVFYRDGLSEGEYRAVAQSEIEAIKDADLVCSRAVFYLASSAGASTAGSEEFDLADWSYGQIHEIAHRSMFYI
ncbi:hypothetical protein ONZ45_g13146 [Pleurotus djamor]|nr:hypothetical protein ONZ45_g13146 [Pleurotus djamor]